MGRVAGLQISPVTGWGLPLSGVLLAGRDECGVARRALLPSLFLPFLPFLPFHFHSIPFLPFPSFLVHFLHSSFLPSISSDFAVHSLLRASIHPEQLGIHGDGHKPCPTQQRPSTSRVLTADPS